MVWLLNAWATRLLKALRGCSSSLRESQVVQHVFKIDSLRQ
jgi:hypothetical protein